jgi:serine acetyltransferase
MRAVSLHAIAVFHLLLVLVFGPAFAAAFYVNDALPPGDFRGLITAVFFVGMVYAAAIVVQRLFLLAFPIPQGVIARKSKAEFAYHICLLFYLLFINSLIKTSFIPVTFTRYIYILLGAKLGANTYCAGVILDPPMTSVGSNTILGHDCVICAHAIEGENLSYEHVTIGSNVTIGGKAMVMPGVSISDGAIVAAGSIVTKGTKIGKRELWGGIPAKKLKDLPLNYSEEIK